MHSATARVRSPARLPASPSTSAEPRHERFDDAFSALAYADPDKKPAVRSFDQMWSAWADVRGTGWDGHGGAAGTDGRQINVTAGIGRKLTPDFVVGVVGGYEHFDYDATSLSGTLKGDGGSVGGFLGARFGDALKLDAAAVWSGIAYDGTAGGATGSFDASRWLVSTGLSGSQSLGAFVFEPSAHVFALWEGQGSWTDSAAVAHAAQDFSNGRASAGAKVSYPWMTDVGGTRISSYVGAYGDYRFGSDSVVGPPIVSVENGFSGRVTSGIAVSNASGATLGLDGEVGGFGSSYLIWSARARAGMPF